MKTTAVPIRNRLGSWAFALLALAGAASCGGDDDHGADTEKGSGAVCPSGSTLSYENFGSTFMQTYCTRCHASTLTGDARQGAPADHNFDTLKGILLMAEHIDKEAAAGPDAVNTAMPPSDPKPMEADRRKLGEWLACETADSDGGTQGDSGGTQGDGGRGDTGTQADGGRDTQGDGRGDR